MDRKTFEPYKLNSLADLRAAIDTLHAEIPLSEDLSPLTKPYMLGDRKLDNSMLVHPMEGFDGEFSGAPSSLTQRRYERFTAGGASVIWFEAIAVCQDGRTSPNQLMLCDQTLDDYKRLCDKLHSINPNALLVCQLTHSGRFSKPTGKPAPVVVHRNPRLDAKFGIPEDYPLVTDDTLDRIEEDFMRGAHLAVEAGFDALDVKACHFYLLSELLSGYEREGKYGGSYENRTRFMREVFAEAAREGGSKVIMASRYSPYDHVAYPHGFGVDHTDFEKFDFSESIKLIGELETLGLKLIDLTMSSPYLEPHINRPNNCCEYIPPEHPLVGVERLIKGTAELKRAFPKITFTTAGMSYLRENAPYVLAGCIKEGINDLAGLGRMSFAYPDFAKDMLTKGALDRRKCCITCGKCTELMRAGKPAGCPVRDSEIYLPLLREIPKYAPKK